MEKKYMDNGLDELTDEEIDALINEQFLNEAQIMQEALFSGEDMEEYDASDEKIRADYQKLVSRLKADGIYCEEDEHTDTADHDASKPAETDKTERGTNKVVAIPPGKSKKIRHKLVKAAGFVVVCGLCVFAATMTSEANRNYFVNNIKILTGDDTRVVVDNDGENETINADEYKARDDIEEQLGIELPRFMYRPTYFEFSGYEINSYGKIAKIEYLYEESTVIFMIDREDEFTASNLYSVHGEVLETLDVDNGKTEIIVRKIQDEQDKEPAYSAQWQEDSTVYCLVGKLNLDEFLKILKSIED